MWGDGAGSLEEGMFCNGLVNRFGRVINDEGEVSYAIGYQIDVQQYLIQHSPSDDPVELKTDTSHSISLEKHMSTREEAPKDQG